MSINVPDLFLKTLQDTENPLQAHMIAEIIISSNNRGELPALATALDTTTDEDFEKAGISGADGITEKLKHAAHFALTDHHFGK